MVAPGRGEFTTRWHDGRLAGGRLRASCSGRATHARGNGTTRPRSRVCPETLYLVVTIHVYGHITLRLSGGTSVVVGSVRKLTRNIIWKHHAKLGSDGVPFPRPPVATAADTLTIPPVTSPLARPLAAAVYLQSPPPGVAGQRRTAPLLRPTPTRWEWSHSQRADE